MAIQVDTYEEAPAIKYDKFFMRSLKINQTLNEEDNSVFKLEVEYQMYGLVDGKKYFKPGVDIITINDYGALAMTKAQLGDMDYVDAMNAIEQSLAKIYAEQTQNNATVITL